jgi:hypothetical protein
MHSIVAKRIVIGRSAPYDTLYQEYTARAKKTQQPTSQEPELKYAPEEDIVALVQIIQSFRPRSQASSAKFSLKALAVQRDYDQIVQACKQ